jgi:hypothetical protein
MAGVGPSKAGRLDPSGRTAGGPIRTGTTAGHRSGIRRDHGLVRSGAHDPSLAARSTTVGADDPRVARGIRRDDRRHQSDRRVVVRSRRAESHGRGVAARAGQRSRRTKRRDRTTGRPAARSGAVRTNGPHGREHRRLGRPGPARDPRRLRGHRRRRGNRRRRSRSRGADRPVRSDRIDSSRPPLRVRRATDHRGDRHLSDPGSRHRRRRSDRRSGDDHPRARPDRRRDRHGRRRGRRGHPTRDSSNCRGVAAGRRPRPVDQPRAVSSCRRQRCPSRVSSTAIPRSASSSRR